MGSTNLTQWLDSHPEIRSCIKYPYGPQARWGRLICQWDEEQAEKKISHVFAACINLQNGDIYLDEDSIQLYAKTILLFIATPMIHLFAKTLYHASCIGIGKVTYLTAKEDQTKKKALKNCVTHMSNLVKTPLYSVAMMVVCASSLILSPFHPTLLYDFRKIGGDIQKNMLRGDMASFWNFSPCFQPRTNLQKISGDFFSGRTFMDTLYPAGSGEIIRGMTHYARSQILHQRKNMFSQVLQKLAD